MSTANKPTPEQLRNLLIYNPLTGDLHWRVDHNNRKAGDEAGTIRKDTGRRVIKVLGCYTFATRVIWAMQTGEWPVGEVDHKDTKGPKSGWGDRWTNLRVTTRAQNSYNSKTSKNNTSGYPGVAWHKGDKKWHARLWRGKGFIHFGSYEKIEDAIAARKRGEQEHFGEFAPKHQ